MKRVLLFVLPVALVLVGCWFITWEPDAPRFRVIKSTFAAPPSTYVDYGLFNPHLPADSTLWLTVGSGTNQPRYLRFDLKRKRVTGEVVGASPMFSDKEGRNVACMQRNARPLSFSEKVKVLVERVTLGKVHWARPARSGLETFWVLNLEHGTATRLGGRMMPQGFTTAFNASPNGRYAFSPSVVPRTNRNANADIYVCDIAARRWWTMPVSQDRYGPDPYGWWDEQNVIIRTADGFDLMDVENGTRRPWLTGSAIRSFFNGINERQAPTLASYWNGREFEFYFFNNIQSQGESSYFVRVRRPDAVLELVSGSFEFETFGRFDTNGTRYVYPTRVVGDCCNGVSLRDLKAGTERVLVPGTSVSGISRPFFYEDAICYLRSNELWQMDVNGSNKVRLFPSPTR
jgi:hypothetical protein